MVGTEAQKLFADARNMLANWVENPPMKLQASFFILPTRRCHDDAAVYADENDKQPLAVFHFLRQQRKMSNGVPNLSLADYLAPKELDYMGGFAVTAGIGLEALINHYEADHDDYNSIMTKALADRLAEALAEFLHEKVRKEYWGYATDESLNNEGLVREQYQGIRPAPGYPACPDHTEKEILFDLFEKHLGNNAISLTESMAMMPASSVSGWYFAREEAKYFGIGKINEDQLIDYAERKGKSVDEMRRWLGPILF